MKTLLLSAALAALFLSLPAKAQPLFECVITDGLVCDFTGDSFGFDFNIGD